MYEEAATWRGTLKQEARKIVDKHYKHIIDPPMDDEHFDADFHSNQLGWFEDRSTAVQDFVKSGEFHSNPKNVCPLHTYYQIGTDICSDYTTQKPRPPCNT